MAQPREITKEEKAYWEKHWNDSPLGQLYKVFHRTEDKPTPVKKKN